MVNLSFLNIDFVRVLEIASEFGRVTLAVSFRPPPPEYTFRGLEPVYKKCIEHYERRCERKFREVEASSEKSEQDVVDGREEDMEPREKKFDELEALLERHCKKSTFDYLLGSF